MPRERKKPTKQELEKKKLEESKVFEDELTKKRKDIIDNIKFKPNIRLKGDKQRKLIQSIHTNQITFISGPAGVGKTYIALKAAIEVLKEDSNPIDKIMLTKPIVEAGEENIGFLPGDQEDKVAPYMHSFYANFEKLIGKHFTNVLRENNILQHVPLAYLRGDTFDKIAVLDEAQNTTVSGMKLFISRMGDNAKIIILGDADQTDLKLKNGQKSGLEDAFERFKGIKNVGFIEFTEDDIVRSKLLIEIMKRYKNQ
jgi:phosphate starvation-inducible PhoH-like protein